MIFYLSLQIKEASILKCDKLITIFTISVTETTRFSSITKFYYIWFNTTWNEEGAIQNYTYDKLYEP